MKAKLTCGDCGKKFKKPQGLGGHRSRVHGVSHHNQKPKKSKSQNGKPSVEITLQTFEPYTTLLQRQSNLESELLGIRNQLKEYAPLAVLIEELRESEG